MDLTHQFSLATKASRSLAELTKEKIDSVIERLASAILDHSDDILAANAKDLESFEQSNPLYDRLLLTPERLKAIAADTANVAKLNSPVGERLSFTERPNGMTIEKVRVPFGVIGVIYEARPNVSFDVFTLCLKSANACVLKGGSDAAHSNEAIAKLIKQVLESEELDPNIVTLLPPSREATAQMLDAVGKIDLIIPRGSSSLISYVRNNSKVPVIETGAGVCHTYVDKFADAKMAQQIILNAKTRRVSVCNALDSIVLHSSMIDSLPMICAPLSDKNVKIWADTPSLEALKGHYPSELLLEANSESYGVEFLDYALSIVTVDSFTQAVDHVTFHSSRHSEAIVSQDPQRAERYAKAVDAACLYINVSTAFTDGAQFGFGAEIGISTQKLHARGPMALPELTTYKYIIRGNGEVRE